MFDYEMISASDLRAGFSAGLSRVQYGQERLLIMRREKIVAALMTYRDFQQIEEFSRESEESKRLKMELAMESWQRAKRRAYRPGDVLIVP